MLAVLTVGLCFYFYYEQLPDTALRSERLSDEARLRIEHRAAMDSTAMLEAQIKTLKFELLKARTTRGVGKTAAAAGH